MRQARDADTTTDPGMAAAEWLAGELEAVVDPALRVDFVRAELRSMGGSRVADLLEALAVAADAGIARHRDTLHVVSVALAPRACLDLRRDAARAAVARGQDHARGLLVPEHREEPKRRDLGGRPGEPGRPATLGERKSLARRGERGILERVMLDPHEDVVTILLGNPALREADVLRLTARRPMPSDVLRAIYVHPRWLTRYAVRLSLVQNPALPTDIGLAIVRTLLGQDAAMVALATELPSSVRARARAHAHRAELH